MMIIVSFRIRFYELYACHDHRGLSQGQKARWVGFEQVQMTPYALNSAPREQLDQLSQVTPNTTLQVLNLWSRKTYAFRDSEREVI